MRLQMMKRWLKKSKNETPKQLWSDGIFGLFVLVLIFQIDPYEDQSSLLPVISKFV